MGHFVDIDIEAQNSASQPPGTPRVLPHHSCWCWWLLRKRWVRAGCTRRIFVSFQSKAMSVKRRRSLPTRVLPLTYSNWLHNLKVWFLFSEISLIGGSNFWKWSIHRITSVNKIQRKRGRRCCPTSVGTRWLYQTCDDTGWPKWESGWVTTSSCTWCKRWTRCASAVWLSISLWSNINKK